ncbi:hypothetical protein [uncultured Marinobacter sp.]|uniref:hypothetical protein n=1 Tax=uncultured Marinobacter sp. TaxID=187379 RepID=UPI002598E91A|nr:hypothetical protein [uncultured Marinobacter sp.]
MTVKCLNDFDQAAIVHYYTHGKMNQTELALHFAVHRRTIQRVLIDKGVLVYKDKGPKPVPLKPRPLQKSLPFDRPSHLTRREQQDMQIVKIVRDAGYETAEDVKKRLDTPPLTRTNVELYLCRLPDSQFAALAYAVGLVRLKQIQDRSEASRKDQEAANG